MNLRELTAALDLNRPQRVLVVEDSVGFARRLVEFLEEIGHQVDALAGVEAISDRDVSGLGLDMQTQTSASLGIDLAFLDHYFVSAKYDGAKLTKELCRRGAVCVVAMSSDEGANRRMIEAGATLSLRKSDLARMLGD